MPGARGHTPATSSLPGCLLLLLDVPRNATPPPGTLSLSLLLSPSPFPLLPNGFVAAVHCHRVHRSPLASPCCPRSPPSSAASPHPGPERWDGLHRRLPHLLPPQSPEAARADSPPSPPPRARRLPHSTHRELPHALPLTPWLAALRSRRFVAGRSTPPLELVVGVAPVTIWSPWRA